MFVSTNTIAAVVSYYKKTLHGLYDVSEIEAIIAMVFEHFLGLSKAQLLLKSDTHMSESELLNFHFALKRLAKGEPIQYVLGETTFYGFPMVVASGVLIPRNETEELVDLIVKETIDEPSILEIGTGSGCIAIALQKNIKNASVTAIDISSEALTIAQKNAQINTSEITFLQHDFLDTNLDVKLGENRWDLIVSNPPYIPMYQKKDMHVNVLNYEPHLALFVEDEDPLIFTNVSHNMAF